MSQPNLCKTCKWWGWAFEGCCDRIDSLPATPVFKIEVTLNDDSGLDAALRTGPDFGCVLHEKKDEVHEMSML